MACFNTLGDSLEQSYSRDTNEVNKLIKLSFYYYKMGTYTSALTSANKAFKLSSELKYEKGQAKSLVGVGNVYFGKSDYENAGRYYSLAYEYAKKINNVRIMADCYNNLGGVFRQEGNYQKALSYYLEALKIEDNMPNEQGDPETYNNVGLLYEETGNSAKAIEFHEKSIALCHKYNNKYVLSANLINLAFIYYQKRDLETALDYFQQALIIKREIGDKMGISLSLMNLGVIYFEKDDNDIAMKYYENALEIAESCNDKNIISSCLRNIGLVYERNKNYKKAIEYQRRALAINFELGLKPYIKEGYYFLATTYAKADNSKKALEYFKLYVALNDSLFNLESHEQIAEMQAKYESEKKQKENEVLAQKNQLLYQRNKIQDLNIQQSHYFIFGLSVFSLLIIGIAFLFIRQNKMNAMHAKIEMEQKLLRSQMNPHFIFNAMVGIQNYIYKEEPEVAANYLSSVVHLMRSIIDNSIKEYVFLDKEISTLYHYLTLQQVRFQDKFNFVIDTEPTVDVESILIPPMMAQPFIENAIVHGIMHKTNGEGMITVKFKTKNDNLVLEIEDNGIGRAKAKEFAKKDDSHLSIATNITQERLKILNRKSKAKNSMSIVDLWDENGESKGTRVTFLFPLMST